MRPEAKQYRYRHDYKQARRIRAEGYYFYALIMAAMLQADSDNLAKLKAAFPDVYEELNLRYDAPGGLLPGERTDEE